METISSEIHPVDLYIVDQAKSNLEFVVNPSRPGQQLLRKANSRIGCNVLIVAEIVDNSMGDRDEDNYKEILGKKLISKEKFPFNKLIQGVTIVNSSGSNQLDFYGLPSKYESLDRIALHPNLFYYEDSATIEKIDIEANSNRCKIIVRAKSDILILLSEKEEYTQLERIALKLDESMEVFKKLFLGNDPDITVTDWNIGAASLKSTNEDTGAISLETMIKSNEEYDRLKESMTSNHPHDQSYPNDSCIDIQVKESCYLVVQTVSKITFQPLPIDSLELRSDENTRDVILLQSPSEVENHCRRDGCPDPFSRTTVVVEVKNPGSYQLKVKSSPPFAIDAMVIKGCIN